jgi:hypothetical protein
MLGHKTESRRQSLVFELEAERCSLLSEPSLTKPDTVTLSHDLCTAVIRTHKCGVDLV